MPNEGKWATFQASSEIQSASGRKVVNAHLQHAGSRTSGEMVTLCWVAPGHPLPTSGESAPGGTTACAGHRFFAALRKWRKDARRLVCTTAWTSQMLATFAYFLEHIKHIATQPAMIFVNGHTYLLFSPTLACSVSPCAVTSGSSALSCIARSTGTLHALDIHVGTPKRGSTNLIRTM